MFFHQSELYDDFRIFLETAPTKIMVPPMAIRPSANTNCVDGEPSIRLDGSWLVFAASNPVSIARLAP